MAGVAKHPLRKQAIIIAIVVFVVMACVVVLCWIGIRMGNGGV